ncbi:actin maturation protease [Pelodytes ibericus]
MAGTGRDSARIVTRPRYYSNRARRSQFHKASPAPQAAADWSLARPAHYYIRLLRWTGRLSNSQREEAASGPPNDKPEKCNKECFQRRGWRPTPFRLRIRHGGALELNFLSCISAGPMASEDGETPAPREVPPPPLPPPALAPPPAPSVVKSKFFKTVADGSDPSAGGCEELKRMIRNRQGRFKEDLKYLLYNNHVPSLIQEGPQCGLVALWMAGKLLALARDVSLENIAAVAVSRGYTAQGEMFSADNMSRLAGEVFDCRCELLSGGMNGENQTRILRHLTAGLPVLIPYDEDFNHEPCQREGHRAHWAVISGVLLGMKNGSFQADPDTPGLYQPPSDSSSLRLAEIKETYLVAKQGKSLRYQLWDYECLSRSNGQLIQFDPKRASDGTQYVVPEGGVRTGLCGQVVLLRHRDDLQKTALCKE